MVDATLSRGSESVTIPLIEEAGTPVISRDVGKPNQQLHTTGRLDPRSQDQWSVLEAYTLIGTFTGSSAYQDARDVQDLIKSHSGGTNLTLDVPLDEFGNAVPVCPAAEQEQACTVTYAPGRTDWVGVEVSLTRVSETLGSGNQSATTPTASGSGPVEISDGSTTLPLEQAISVERTVGRPNSIVRRQPDQYPLYIDHRKTAYDAFDISFRFTDLAVSYTNKIVDMISNQLGRQSLTLDFNGKYGLGQFSVVPRGTSALRTTRNSGTEGTVRVPTISLRRVKN